MQLTSCVHFSWFVWISARASLHLECCINPPGPRHITVHPFSCAYRVQCLQGLAVAVRAKDELQDVFGSRCMFQLAVHGYIHKSSSVLTPSCGIMEVNCWQ
eukprot:1158044-Pelagomonas_calceolata.AAC.9